MTVNEFLERIKELRIKDLEEENKRLREILNKGSSGNTTTYSIIREMIREKVSESVPLDPNDFRGEKHKREVAERKVMSDLKWRNKSKKCS